jgi:hypothetical protein
MLFATLRQNILPKDAYAKAPGATPKAGRRESSLLCHAYRWLVLVVDEVPEFPPGHPMTFDDCQQGEGS